MSLGKSDFKSYGSRDEVLWFLESVFSKRHSIEYEDLKKLHNSAFGTGSLQGLIYLFEKVGFIHLKKTSIDLANKDQWNSSESEFSFLIKRVIEKLKVDKEHNFFFSKEFIVLERGNLYFIGNMIPLHAAALRNLFISLGVFETTQTQGLYLINDMFLKILEVNPEINLGKKFLQTQLEEEIQTRNLNFKKAGEVSEEWVLSFEKNKFANLDEKLRSKIARISQDYARAGFDIISYKDEFSTYPDKLIEVKSYAVNRYFFWSENEINKAFEERENYFLYLVDRSLMNSSNYVPIEIQDPALVIFNEEKRDNFIQSSKDKKYDLYADGWKIEF